MKKDNKEIAEIIEQKIFTFKDLVSCEDEDLALIITDIKNLKSLAFALKKCDDALSEKLKNNLSARQKEILTEEEKTMPEKIKDKDVANAHSEILGIAKKLAKSEKINPLIKESKGKDHKVLKFPMLRSSIMAYQRNLNTHKAYGEFREKRASLREDNKKISGLHLVSYVESYAATGKEYVKILKNIISQNKLTDFDNSILMNTNNESSLIL